MFEKDRDTQRRKQFREIGTYTAIPMMMIVGPALGYGLGYLAEQRWGHAPWFTVGGCIFGLAAAVR